ncbi:hypothetical protein EHP00_982 [Ecytonucleospora hepatopenaei]|uniref:Uncharacterized protein n=1 Tax=Ecytonucleospora hepatopenaei TaxID=646526 RepID=A0A1W0E690_9MICR|nr:hypothetical protein EHP00_982 [Ecytonucleospora hepatopenaei]
MLFFYFSNFFTATNKLTVDKDALVEIYKNLRVKYIFEFHEKSKYTSFLSKNLFSVLDNKEKVYKNFVVSVKCILPVNSMVLYNNTHYLIKKEVEISVKQCVFKVLSEEKKKILVFKKAERNFKVKDKTQTFTLYKNELLELKFRGELILHSSNSELLVPKDYICPNFVHFLKNTGHNTFSETKVFFEQKTDENEFIDDKGLVVLIDDTLFNKLFENKHNASSNVFEIFMRVFSEKGLVVANSKMELEKVKQNKPKSSLNSTTSTEFDIFGKKDEDQLIKKEHFFQIFLVVIGVVIVVEILVLVAQSKKITNKINKNEFSHNHENIEI